MAVIFLVGKVAAGLEVHLVEDLRLEALWVLAVEEQLTQVGLQAAAAAVLEEMVLYQLMKLVGVALGDPQ
jgi:hypothetical protein